MTFSRSRQDSHPLETPKGRVFGKVAVVTGAASGIGRATALLLAAEGAMVLATDIDDAGGKETVRLARDEMGHCLFLKHDVANEDSWRSVIDAVLTVTDGLHILVNNAGIALSGSTFEMSYQDWRRQLAVNLDSVFLGMKHGIPLMARSGGGSVVNVSSIAGLIGDRNFAGYSAGKGGVRLLSKSVALECARARNGVRVNSFHPGIINTPIWTTDSRSTLRADPKRGRITRMWRRATLDAVSLAGVPIGFAGTTADAADGILYLASDESRYVTGSELVVDGGFTGQ